MNQFPMSAILLPLLALPVLLACGIGASMLGISGLRGDETGAFLFALVFFSLIYRLAYRQANFHFGTRPVRIIALGIATGAWLLLCLGMLTFFKFGFPATLFWLCFYAWLMLWEGRKFARAWRAALARSLHCHLCGAQYELDNEWTCACGHTGRKKHPADKCRNCGKKLDTVKCLQCSGDISVNINQKFPKGYPSLLEQLKDIFGGTSGTSRTEPTPMRAAQPQPQAPAKPARTRPEPNPAPANVQRQQPDTAMLNDLDDLRVVVADDLDVFERLGKAFLDWQRTKAEQESKALNGLVEEMQRDKVAYTVQELQKELVQEAKTHPLRTLGKVLYVHYAVKKLETASEILRRLAPHAMRELESR